MIPNPPGSPRHCRGRATAAFTLIEVLVAMAVLALMLVLLTQVMSGVLQSTRVQNQQLDSVAVARRALDVMALDLRKAVIGETATVLVPTPSSSGNPSPIFSVLTNRRGPNGVTGHRFLAVTYSTSPDQELFRSYESVDMAKPDLLEAAKLASPTNTPQTSLLATGILAMKFFAVTDDGNYEINQPVAASPPGNNWAATTATKYNGLTVPTGYQALVTESTLFSDALDNRTRALEIWVAAVDEKNLAVLKDTSKLSAVKTKLASADPEDWRSEIDGLDIPGQAKSGIRILNQTVSLQ